jgi:3-carboxy-cis,cis-muconate cycloisomerase
MTSLIRELSGSTPAMAEAFGDAALLRAALAFEAQLAAAEAEEGLVSVEEAADIEAACRELPDAETMARAAAHAGTLAIPLVAELRERLNGRSAAAKVHLGATSQDVADTALVLQARSGLELIGRDLERLAEALAALAAGHARTPLLGRTLLQPARATTFGLKCAGWLLGVEEAWARLERESAGAICLQFGGAVGALDGLGGRGLEVSRRLAARLGLVEPPAPWHARRNGLAGLGSALAILTGAVGKMARDISLLAQADVAEVFEPHQAGRGGSSAMSHKRNPTGCQVALSAALRAPHLAGAMISSLPDELERGLGGWQAQGPLLAELFGLAHGAVVAMADVAGALEAHPERMAANLRASGVSDDFGEAPTIVLRVLAMRESRDG